MVRPDTGDREGGQRPPWGGQQEAGVGEHGGGGTWCRQAEVGCEERERGR